jgi:hypothetical protein
MTHSYLTTLAASFALTTAAAADFMGYTGIVDEGEEFVTINVYAAFDDSSNAVLNIFGADIHTKDGLGFDHSDAGGGTWKPTLSLDIPGFADPTIDSYVTVGYGVGSEASTNGTSLDPSFLDPTGGGLGPYIPMDAGWYNGNPNNPQYAGSDGLVHLGQFVFETARVDAAGAFDFFVFNCEIGYNNGPGSGETFFGDGQYVWFIPAPGALAILGLGGLVTRHRRC